MSKMSPNLEMGTLVPWDLNVHFLLTRTMSTIKVCGTTSSIGIFLDTNKHQNFTRPRCPYLKNLNMREGGINRTAFHSLTWNRTKDIGAMPSIRQLLTYTHIKKEIGFFSKCSSEQRKWTWIPWNLFFRHILFHEISFSDMDRKWILPNMIRAGTDCTNSIG